MTERPLLVHIRRHSLEDGPGIRTVVFFKGCPLSCTFCHNPEAQEPGLEIAFSPEACVECGSCADVCPQGAVDANQPGRIRRDLCRRCGACADACPGNGLKRIGRYRPVEELCDLLFRDRVFYRHSGGGVTLSGGECTLYPGYLRSLLELLKKRDTHVTLETSGYFDYETFASHILPYTDLIYYDIKIADPAAHAAHTGLPNKRICDNLERLVREEKATVHPRIPLVPGVTDTRENLSAIIDFLCRIGAKNVSLLPYNPLGLRMYQNLGKPVPALPERFMDRGEESRLLTEVKTLIEDRRVRAGGG